jgi:hypothetical protein
MKTETNRVSGIAGECHATGHPINRTTKAELRESTLKQNMKTKHRQNLLAVALICTLGLISLIPAKTSAATVVITTGPGRYYYNGAYYPYHYGNGYYNYRVGKHYYLYSHGGYYYNKRIWVAPKNGRRGYYRYY